ncbi:MAG TPA: ABC transporter ATP-binding protein [Candidatus Sphingobacterium stercorigallinarum]|nr:ABC transporter ATP-binding protein [Candidatus Sphingobacterium stercorigallinarum]
MSTSPILQVREVTKQFGEEPQKLTILHPISFDIQAGDTVSIVGPSGSGKTTLLGLCAGLDQASSGQIFLKDVPLVGRSEDELAKIRNEHVGFVFQNFQLLPTLTALENIQVPMELKGQRKGVRQDALRLLQQVGLEARADHYPTQLSGGEQQRIALARAFANQPAILFADEPTGSLDAETGAMIEQLLFELNKQQGTTLVMVTHDLELASKTDVMIPIKGGRLQ